MGSAVTITPDAPQVTITPDAPPSAPPAKRSWLDSASDFAGELWNNINPVNAVKGAATAIAHPIQTYANDAATREQIRQKAEDAFSKGNYADGAAMMLSGIVPLLGPASQRAGDFMEQGQYAKGFGAATGIGLSLAAPKIIQGMKLPGLPTEGAASKLYQSALKPSTTLEPVERAGLVQTGLQNAIPVSEGGIDKLNGLVNDLQKQVAGKIASNPNAPINTLSVASRLGDTGKKFATQVNPAADLKAIQQTGQEFVDTQPKNIPASQAQALKQGTYQVLGDKAYGEMDSATVEAQKALARGLKEELETQFPEIKGLNAQAGKLYDLEPILNRAVGRISNHQLVGIGTPIAAAGAKSITGSNAAAGAAGILKAIVDDPIVKSHLAIALNRASKGQLSLDNAMTRVGAYSNALGNAANAQTSGGQNTPQPFSPASIGSIQ